MFFQICLKHAIGDGCEFDTSFKDIALWLLQKKRNELQKMSVVSSFWLVLLKRGWLSMLRGIWAGKYDEGNMSRRKIYCILFVIVTAIVQPRTPLWQSKPSPAFQTVYNNEEICLFFPLKRTKETEKSKKIYEKKSWPTFVPTPNYTKFFFSLFLLCFVNFFSSQNRTSAPLYYAVNRLKTKAQKLQRVWF